MKYTSPFLIKLAVTLGVLLVVLGLFFGASLADILIISVVLTVLAFIGDLVVLTRTNNMIATVGDLILSFLVVWVLGSYLFEPDINVFSAALLSSLFIAGGELYYHRYLRNRVFENIDKPHFYHQTRMTQTEFAEEFEVDYKKNHDKG